MNTDQKKEQDQKVKQQTADKPKVDREKLDASIKSHESAKNNNSTIRK